MSCICEYFIHPKDRDLDVTSDSNSKLSLPGSSNNKEAPSLGSEASASDIASARAEIWLLKKSVHENRISIENLENLVKVMMERQNVMLTEMCRLKRSNFELREECRIQRDYHSMERNAMLRELHDIRQLLSNRSKMLEETTLKNAELINSVLDANEKIYLMGMKYLKLKNVNYQPLRIKHYSESSDECEEELGDESSESEKSD